ncbi:MAG: aspartyl/glutamyl-tRNA amidotransferase subunit C [Clostridia bacterium]|nr:aspartyl/glutamyl-tRNA amidotransferase subunit C [Clostridia bacterium]
MELNLDFPKLARLAQLSFSQEEESALRKDLMRIADFAREVSELPDEANSLRAEGICLLREDRVGSCLSPCDILAAAPAHEKGMITVPSVMEDSHEDPS